MTIGALIGPYRLLRHLGSGGMGDVWLAEDTRLHRQVALKMVRADAADADARSRLMREARAAAALNHPHIATVHDVLEHDGEVVIVFEYVEGETLHARIARGTIDGPEAVGIATQIAKALAAAHAQGIVHRDLKPANVIIGADHHVKVLDFGVARVLAVGTTHTSSVTAPPTASGFGFIGTASYAAPEQMVSSAVDERADLYALGVVLFEMISGRRPFKSNDPVELATAKLGRDAPSLASTGKLVPPVLEQIVASLLDRDRERRPASAHDVLAQLRLVYGNATTIMLPRRRARMSALAIAAMTIATVMIGAALWGIRPRVGGSVSTAPPVVAILPLSNMSGDNSRDYLAAGISESLISSLASVPTITVLSRTSVVDARSRTKDVHALTKDLGVNYVVEGSLQESSGRLRVSLNLVKPDRSVTWADSIEGTFDQIFELQSRLASALTSALVIRLSASERERMNQPATANPQALASYWRGRALMERGDVAGNREAAIANLLEATRLDPNFAVAFAALGRVYWDKYTETKEPEWTTKALDAGATALRLDASLPEARYAMAITLSGSGRLDEAVRELTTALAVQPNYDDARRMLGLVLARQGKLDAAIAEFKKAIALRPTFWQTYSSLGNVLLPAAKYDQAIEAFQAVIKLQPDSYVGYQQLGTAYQTIGKKEEALANYERATAIRPNPQAYSNIGTLEYERGNYAAAAAAYASAIKLRPNAAATHRNLGDALTKLGRFDEAQHAYREAIRLAEAELKVNPSDARALASLAIYLAKAGDSEASQRRVADALRIAEGDIEVMFRCAVAAAVSKQTRLAMEYLRGASQRGYSATSIASTDEFDSLRDVEEFQQLIKSARP